MILKFSKSFQLRNLTKAFYEFNVDLIIYNVGTEALNQWSVGMKLLSNVSADAIIERDAKVVFMPNRMNFQYFCWRGINSSKVDSFSYLNLIRFWL
jgi:hypothetical protein